MAPPSDGPPGLPPAAPPPPPPVEEHVAATPTPAQPRHGPNPWLLLGVGLLAGVLLGGGGGYLVFHGGGGTVATTVHPATSPTPAGSGQPTISASPIPSASASAAAQGVVPCPVVTPANQHPLGDPAPPTGGRSASATLDFCGEGSATIPGGTTRFTTNANWEIGIADSCPQGSSGEGGMGTVLTVTETLPDGSAGPDSVMQPGDFADSGAAAMATGGNYQLQVTAVAPECVWHIAIYTS